MKDSAKPAPEIPPPPAFRSTQGPTSAQVRAFEAAAAQIVAIADERAPDAAPAPTIALDVPSRGAIESPSAREQAARDEWAALGDALAEHGGYAPSSALRVGAASEAPVEIDIDAASLFEIRPRSLRSFEVTVPAARRERSFLARHGKAVGAACAALCLVAAVRVAFGGGEEQAASAAPRRARVAATTHAAKAGAPLARATASTGAKPMKAPRKR
jgi:hypothetical protein